MNYPNGKKATQTVGKLKQKETNFSNRGMTLEEDINETNIYYRATNKAVIHKKPTPIQIVKVDYPKRSAAVIKEGYFKQASTTDFNGVYKGKYIDFEAKETRNKTSFPLNNVHEHQVNHMNQVTEQKGIAFIIVRFTQLDQTYLLPAEHLFSYWNDQFNGGRKSIPFSCFETKGFIIPFHYQARVDYLSIIDKFYF